MGDFEKFENEKEGEETCHPLQLPRAFFFKNTSDPPVPASTFFNSRPKSVPILDVKAYVKIWPEIINLRCKA